LKLYLISELKILSPASNNWMLEKLQPGLVVPGSLVKQDNNGVTFKLFSAAKNGTNKIAFNPAIPFVAIQFKFDWAFTIISAL